MTNRIQAGDVFCVPLGKEEYGYIRAYEGGNDFSIFNIISRKILNLSDIENVGKLDNDIDILTDKIKSGEWFKIGNLPLNEHNKWAKPRKQLAPYWNPDVKYVLYKGQYILAKEFGQYDELPPLIKQEPEDTILYILSNAKRL